MKSNLKEKMNEFGRV